MTVMNDVINNSYCDKNTPIRNFNSAQEKSLSKNYTKTAA